LKTQKKFAKMQQSKPSVGRDFVQTSTNIQDPDAARASIKQAFCWNRFCSDENENPPENLLNMIPLFRNLRQRTLTFKQNLTP
jgi:hypothetical protein